MRWAGHVARMGRGEVYIGLWWGTTWYEELEQEILIQKWGEKIFSNRQL